MKNIILILFFISITLVLVSCDNSLSEKTEIYDTLKTNISESKKLLYFLENSGNFVNSDKIPALITASALISEKNECLIIDIRKLDDYISGHIDGAINIKTEELYNYLFNKIVASIYNKIIIVGYNGLQESYITSIFRMLGFGNIFALKYGMCSWNVKFAKDYWLSHTNSNLINKTETTYNQKAQKSSLPNISTGKNSGFEIAEARAITLLSEGQDKSEITIAEFLKNPKNYYTINYWDTTRYEIAHLPGAMQYEPEKSLSSSTSLFTIPVDRPIVVYCFSGHHSAQVVAFLRILGYDAKSLIYGANSFMFNIMKTNSEIGKWFDASTNIMDFIYIEGELPSINQQTTDSI
jgi:rhodanese-related sulfurtransferase